MTRYFWVLSTLIHFGSWAHIYRSVTLDSKIEYMIADDFDDKRYVELNISDCSKPISKYELGSPSACTSHRPSLSLDKPTVYFPEDISVQLLNNDTEGCLSTTFSFNADQGGQFNSPVLRLSVGQQGSSTLSVDTSNLLEGIYPFKITASDIDNQHPDHEDQQVDGNFIYDVTPPSVPHALRRKNDGKRYGVTIRWNSSTDNVSGLSHYDIYRDGIYLGSTSSEIYVDGTAKKWEAYVYTVRAVDKANNASQLSYPLGVIAWLEN